MGNEVEKNSEDRGFLNGFGLFAKKLQKTAEQYAHDSGAVDFVNTARSHINKGIKNAEKFAQDSSISDLANDVGVYAKKAAIEARRDAYETADMLTGGRVTYPQKDILEYSNKHKKLDEELKGSRILQKGIDAADVVANSPIGRGAKYAGNASKDSTISALKGAMFLPETAVSIINYPMGGEFVNNVKKAGVRFNDAQQILNDSYSEEYKKEIQEIEKYRNSIIPQPIPIEELKKLQNLVNTGDVQDVVRAYGALYDQGYKYAGWAQGVAAGNTVSGQAALGFLRGTASDGQGSDAPVELSQEAIDKIRVDMVHATLEKYRQIAAQEGGVLKRDLTYAETKDIHERVFRKNHLSLKNWTLDTPMEIYRHFFGDEGVEKIWPQIRDTGGHGLKALIQNGALFGAVLSGHQSEDSEIRAKSSLWLKQFDEADEILGPIWRSKKVNSPETAQTVVTGINGARDAGISVLESTTHIPEAIINGVDVLTGGSAKEFANRVGIRPQEAREILRSWRSENSDDSSKKEEENSVPAPTSAPTHLNSSLPFESFKLDIKNGKKPFEKSSFWNSGESGTSVQEQELPVLAVVSSTGGSSGAQKVSAESGTDFSEGNVLNSDAPWLEGDRLSYSNKPYHFAWTADIDARRMSRDDERYGVVPVDGGYVVRAQT